jgi:hypothetical protein
MKKALLGTFVTLLVIAALVSCDDVIGGLGGEKVEYTPDGRKLVEVKIPTGGDRSITDGFAGPKVNYVEVIFFDGTQYYKTGGFKGTTLRVMIPADTYGDANAIMLVGNRSGNDYMLLGTGRVTANGAVPNANPMEFTVTYINTDLSVGGSFEIDETSISTIPVDFTGTTDKGEIEGFGNCFQVPVNKTDIKASLEFTTGFAVIYGKIKMAIPAVPQPLVTFTEFINTTTPTPIILGTTTPANGGTIPADAKFLFQFTTGAVGGNFMISFNIPVVGFDPSVPDGITWYIRGGTISGQPDFSGGKEDSVVLAVLANPVKGKVQVEIK